MTEQEAKTTQVNKYDFAHLLKPSWESSTFLSLLICNDKTELYSFPVQEVNEYVFHLGQYLFAQFHGHTPTVMELNIPHII